MANNSFGINHRDGNWDNPTVRQWMVETGASYIRTSIGWRDCQPIKNAPINFAPYDATFQSYLNAGLSPVVIVWKAPPDVTPTHSRRSAGVC